MMRLIILLLCFSTWAVHAENDWKLVKEKNNINIYSQQKPTHKLKHYKTITTINKNVETILAALQDTDACSEWVDQCISNKMVSMTDFSKRIYHTILDSPLWFKDREFYLQSQVDYRPQEKLFTIKLTSVPDYAAADKKKVRLKNVQMVWFLKSIGKESTEVTYQVYLDPQLPIKAINHQVIKRSIFQNMQGLKKLVKKSIYAKEKFSQSELDMLMD